jgi:hypothetical protein
MAAIVGGWLTAAGGWLAGGGAAAGAGVAAGAGAAAGGATGIAVAAGGTVAGLAALPAAAVTVTAAVASTIACVKAWEIYRDSGCKKEPDWTCNFLAMPMIGSCPAALAAWTGTFGLFATTQQAKTMGEVASHFKVLIQG